MIPVDQLVPGQWISTVPHGPAHQVANARPSTSGNLTVVTFVGEEPVTYGPGAMLYPAAAPERACCECGDLLREGTPAHVRRCHWCAALKFMA